MAFDVEIWDLAVWSGISSLILLITSEVISPYYGRNVILLNTKSVRNIGIGLGVFFVIIAIARLILTLSS